MIRTYSNKHRLYVDKNSAVWSIYPCSDRICNVIIDVQFWTVTCDILDTMLNHTTLKFLCVLLISERIYTR